MLDNLKESLKVKRAEMRENWNRTLPTSELFFDRWEKAEFLGFGKGSSVYDSCVVLGDVVVGENVWIGPHTILDGSGGSLKIGNFCDISAGVHIYTHDTVRRALSSGEEGIETASTEIGDNCHIGANSVVLKGVNIGHHSVVGAGCVVTKSFPPYSIILGVPSRRVGEVKVESGKPVEFVYEKDSHSSD